MRTRHLILVAILIIAAFFRFYELDQRLWFKQDQIQDAWIMKGIMDDGVWPLRGPAVKGSSGFSLGPAYYYILAPLYFFSDLDPIAAGYFAGFISLSTMGVLYLVTCRIFSDKVALLSVFISAVSYSIIISDRTSWNVSLIPAVALGIFYALYRVMLGSERAVLLLGTLLGFAFHIHFTAVYFVLITIITLPFFPRTIRMLKYSAVACMVFLLWFVPHIISAYFQNDASVSSLVRYIQTYYHGFHVRRIIQLIPDAFIEYEPIFYFRNLRFLKYVILPVFLYFYVHATGILKARPMVLLVILWFVIPLLVLSVYSGEISSYYFASTRVVVIFTTAYIISEMYRYRNMIISTGLFLLLVVFSVMNIYQFFSEPRYGRVPEIRSYVRAVVKDRGSFEYYDGNLYSYFYYLYGQRKQ